MRAAVMVLATNFVENRIDFDGVVALDIREAVVQAPSCEGSGTGEQETPAGVVMPGTGTTSELISGEK